MRQPIPFVSPIAFVAGLACAATVAGAQKIQWFHGTFDAACRAAESNEQCVLVYFWSEGSPACASFWQGPMQSERVVQATTPFVCFSAKYEDRAASALFGRYSVQVLPALIMIDPSDATAQDGIVGSMNAPTVMRRL